MYDAYMLLRDSSDWLRSAVAIGPFLRDPMAVCFNVRQSARTTHRVMRKGNPGNAAQFDWTGLLRLDRRRRDGDHADHLGGRALRPRCADPPARGGIRLERGGDLLRRLDR